MGVLDRLGVSWYENLNEAKSAGKPYNYIVFLAGINDINMYGRDAGPVFERMKELWKAGAKEGSTIMVIPVLPGDFP
jgi:hypothetical protein